VALEREVVDGSEGLAEPAKWDRVRGHEEQIGMGRLEGQGQAHLRPQAGHGHHRHVDAQPCAGSGPEEEPTQVGGRPAQA